MSQQNSRIQSSNFYFPKWFLCNDIGFLFFYDFNQPNFISCSFQQRVCELGLTSSSPIFVWQRDYETISYFNFTHQIPGSQLDEALSHIITLRHSERELLKSMELQFSYSTSLLLYDDQTEKSPQRHLKVFVVILVMFCISREHHPANEGGHLV